MDTVTTVCKWLMFIAISFFFTALGVDVFVSMQRNEILRQQAAVVLADAHTFMFNASTTTYNANIALTELNKPKIGVIAQLYETIRGVRLATDNLNKAAIDERLFLEKQQPEAMAKFNTILDNTAKATDTLNKKIDDVGTKSATTIESLNSSVQKADTAIESLNKVVSNPDIPATISNIKGITADGKETTGYIKVEAKDTADWWHSFLHPTLAQRIYNGVKNVGISVAKFIW